MLSPIARTSLSTAVFEQLRAAILSGRMRKGAALPAERVLSEMLKVNRGAVREGLKRLQQAGLVTIHQGGATRVADFHRTAGLEVLASMIVGPDGSIRTDIARGALQLRSTVAPEVGRLAAKNATNTQMEEISHVVAEMRSQSDDLPQLQALAMEFWERVVDATGNVAYRLAVNSVHATYRQILEQMRHVMSAEIRALPLYAAVARAIAKHQEDVAANKARQLVQLGEQSIERVLHELDP